MGKYGIDVRLWTSRFLSLLAQIAVLVAVRELGWQYPVFQVLAFIALFTWATIATFEAVTDSKLEGHGRPLMLLFMGIVPSVTFLFANNTSWTEFTGWCVVLGLGAAAIIAAAVIVVWADKRGVKPEPMQPLLPL